MIDVEKIENEFKKFVLVDYDSQKKFDEAIRPFVSLDYKAARIFLRLLMCNVSDKNKTMAFNSKAIGDFITKNNSRIHFDVVNDDGNYFKLEEIFEDDSKLFFIDLYNFKKEVKQPFRTEIISHPPEFVKNMSKRIIFYDVDYKWKEIKNKEGNLNIEIYSGWTPENFPERLFFLELSK